MSVQVNTYVLIGVVLGYEAAHEAWRNQGRKVSLHDFLTPYMDSAFDLETNPHENITVLYDGMNGEYIAIGHVIAKTGSWQPFDDPVSCVGDTRTVLTAYVEAINRLVREIGVEPKDRGAFGWHVISHYR